LQYSLLAASPETFGYSVICTVTVVFASGNTDKLILLMLISTVIYISIHVLPDLKGTVYEDMNWIQLDQERFQQRAFVDTVMNLWVP